MNGPKANPPRRPHADKASGRCRGTEAPKKPKRRVGTPHAPSSANPSPPNAGAHRRKVGKGQGARPFLRLKPDCPVGGSARDRGMGDEDEALCNRSRGRRGDHVLFCGARQCPARAGGDADDGDAARQLPSRNAASRMADQAGVQNALAPPPPRPSLQDNSRPALSDGTGTPAYRYTGVRIVLQCSLARPPAYRRAGLFS